jgi:hypothetical protein
MKPSIPTNVNDDARPFGMWDLQHDECELIELTRKLRDDRQAALLSFAEDRRDERLADRPAGTSPLPLTPRKGPFYCLADLTIREVSLLNCFRIDRAPLEIWAELARLQCEQMCDGRKGAAV